MSNCWDQCTHAATRRATRRLGQLYDMVLAPTGLRTTQFSILSQIGPEGSPTLSHLAEAMVMDLSALGRTLRPLERDGFVTLVADARDRRVKHAELTDRGRAMLADCARLWCLAQSGFDMAFGAEASADLRRALGQVASEAFAERFMAEVAKADEPDATAAARPLSAVGDQSR